MSACNPVFNWREVRFEPTSAVALLPCKPDRATRDVPLLKPSVGSAEATGVAVPLQMAGCSAGGATFTVSVVRMPSGSTEAQAKEALERWRTASLVSQSAQQPKTSEAAVRGAQLALLVRATAQPGADGSPDTQHLPKLASRAIYAMRIPIQDGEGPVLMQAQMLGEPNAERDGPGELSVQAWETLVGGLSL